LAKGLSGVYCASVDFKLNPMILSFLTIGSFVAFLFVCLLVLVAYIFFYPLEILALFTPFYKPKRKVLDDILAVPVKPKIRIEYNVTEKEKSKLINDMKSLLDPLITNPIDPNDDQDLQDNEDNQDKDGEIVPGPEDPRDPRDPKQIEINFFIPEDDEENPDLFLNEDDEEGPEIREDQEPKDKEDGEREGIDRD